jgi:hypothetical protein
MSGEMPRQLGARPRKWLEKKARQGMRGFPVGTIAFYGPDDRRASKVAVSIMRDHGELAELRRWFCDDGDVRNDEIAFAEITTFLRDHGVRTVAMMDGIIGCPHEEAIDYPEGENCPKCPFWAGRDRWTGKLITD